MKSLRYLYAGAVVVALVVGLGFWNPTHVKADQDDVPKFRLDPYWPKPLPAPIGYNPYTWPTPGGFPDTAEATYGTIGTAIGTDNTATPDYNTTANRWVQGEVAASCVDANDNVYTFNRGWEVGVVYSSVTYNNESGNIVGNDGTPAHALPSPPVVEFDPQGNTIAGWGNPTLHTTTGTYGAYTGTAAIGRSAYMPHGAHGCTVDYQGYVYVGGNGDGIVQQYNPTSAAAAGAAATYTLQIGTKDYCDSTTGTCSETTDLNSSHVLLNEPSNIAVDPNPGPISGTRGDIYISDGYGNHRVVVFNYLGQYIGQWGASCGFNETPNGTDTPGTPCPFNTFGATGGGHPHCVHLGDDGLVYLCDRPNSRILVIGKTSKWIQPSTGPSCASVPNTSACVAPTPADPVRVIYIGGGGGQTNFPDSLYGTPAATAILFAGDRACDLDNYPNHDSNYTLNVRPSKYIVDVDLESDNGYLLEKPPASSTGNATELSTIVSAFGRCGIKPCPGHNAGEFAYSHTTASDSKGNVVIAETITGRRIQKWLKKEGDQDKH